MNAVVLTFSDNLLQDNQIIFFFKIGLVDNFEIVRKTCSILGEEGIKFTLHNKLCHLIETFLYHADVG